MTRVSVLITPLQHYCSVGGSTTDANITLLVYHSLKLQITQVKTFSFISSYIDIFLFCTADYHYSSTKYTLAIRTMLELDQTILYI